MREFLAVGAFAGWALAAPLQPESVVRAGTGIAGAHYAAATVQAVPGGYATAYAAQQASQDSWLSPNEVRQGAKPGSPVQEDAQSGQRPAGAPSVYYDGEASQQITWQDFSRPAPRPAQPRRPDPNYAPIQPILPPPPAPQDEDSLPPIGPAVGDFRPSGFGLNLPYAQQQAQQAPAQVAPTAPLRPSSEAISRPSSAVTPRPVPTPVAVAPPAPIAASPKPVATTFSPVVSPNKTTTTTTAPAYTSSSPGNIAWEAAKPWMAGVYTGLSWLGSAMIADATGRDEPDTPDYTPPAYPKSDFPGTAAGPMTMPTGATPFRNSVWNPNIRDPAQGPTFQIILTGTPDLQPGQSSVVPDVDIYDIDMFTTTKEIITQLKGMGKLVICYFSAGTYEPDRPDSGDYASADLGHALAQWPNEKWVNLTSPKIREIVGKRIQYAHDKGCDAIDPDNIDGYQSPRGGGLGITAQETIDFVKFLSDEALKHKLAVGLKNALDIIPRVAEYVHFAVNEECVQMNECNKYNEFLREYGKPVFHIEYPPPRGSAWSALSSNSPTAADLVSLNATDRYRWCDEGSVAGQDLNFQTVIKPKNLDGYVMYCNGSQYTTPTLKINGRNEAESGREGGSGRDGGSDGLAALQAIGSGISALNSFFGSGSSASSAASASASAASSNTPSTSSSGSSGSSGLAALSSYFGGGSSASSNSGGFLSGLSSLFGGGSSTRGSGSGAGGGSTSTTTASTGSSSGSTSFLSGLFGGGGSGSSSGSGSGRGGGLISGLGSLLGFRGSAGPDGDLIEEQ